MQVSVPYNRRLADKLVMAAKAACEENDREVAALLLATLELAMIRPVPEGLRNRRKNMDALQQIRQMVAYLRQTDDFDHQRSVRAMEPDVAIAARA